MNQYTEYYKTLGLPTGASRKEIKRAFRKKAMLTHPDKNPDPNAKILFSEINTAYEILTGQRSLPKHVHHQSHSEQKHYKAKKETKRATRRERMREARRKKEEAYKKSPEFKKHLAIGILLDQIGYFIAILALLSIPFIFFYKPVMGLVCGIALIPLTYPLWYRALFTPYNTIEFNQFSLAIKYVYTNTHFKYYLFGFINLILILNIVCNTFVYFSPVLFIMATPSLILTIKHYFLKQKIKNNQWFKASCLGPLLVNVFFIINFTFSHSPVNEYQAVSSRYNRGSSFFMSFKQNAYEEYPSVRFFMTYRTNYHPYVHLKIRKGAFGIRVLKHYDFVNLPKKKKHH